MSRPAMIEKLLAKLGVDPALFPDHSCDEAISARRRALGGMDSEQYLALVAESAAEQQALVESLLVSETWFFRGGDLFVHLAGLIRTRMADQPGRPFQVLSAPCSTGEEPYSLAMALADAGVQFRNVRLLAIDISQRNIDAAKAGLYREFSFRQTDPVVRARHFRPEGDRWRIDESIRGSVEFRRENLLEAEHWSKGARFDLIFCRNLLIYLRPESRSAVTELLARLLAPNGVICTGHAEPLNAFDPRFVSMGARRHFLFHLKGAETKSFVPKLLSTPVRSALAPVGSQLSKLLVEPMPASAVSEHEQSVSISALEDARAFADRGDYGGSLRICQQLLAGGVTTAEVYNLMGIVHQAQGDTAQARACYDRALYLCPDHRDSLLGLMLICEQSGHAAQASQLRRRLARSVASGGPQ